ncbi:MAG: C40 family peptidase [Bacteroidia bacterium]
MDSPQYHIHFRRVALCISLLVVFLASCRSHKSASSAGTASTSKAEAEKLSALKMKYAAQLGVRESELNNIKLFQFIDEWYSAPYKYGGLDKTGIDCSGFAFTLYNIVYSKKVARSTGELYSSCTSLDNKDLKEGDLVFFKIEKKDVSHVGVYLMNNKFIHASTKKGVIINDLNEVYYKKYFYKAGRIK